MHILTCDQKRYLDKHPMITFLFAYLRFCVIEMPFQYDAFKNIT